MKAGRGKKGKDVPVQAMNAYRGSRHIAPLSPNFSARWRSVVNITPRQLYPTSPPGGCGGKRERTAQHPLNTRLGRLQSQSGRTGGDENLIRIK
jgi:hypothetical protein